MLMYLIWVVSIFDDGSMTSTFDDYLYYGCSTLSLVLLCDVAIIISP
jgi:hypothetical protein